MESEMTAEALWVVVKAVPREAWPRLDYITKTNSGRPLWVIGAHPWHVGVPVDHAVLLFEASMARWLHTKGHSVNTYTTTTGARIYVTNWATGEQVTGAKITGATLIEAIAAACLALKGPTT